MPLYEFECLSCGERFEILCKSSDTDDIVCEKCGRKVKRLISSFSSRVSNPMPRGCELGSCETNSCGMGSCCHKH